MDLRLGIWYIPAFKKKVDFVAYFEKFVNDYKNKDLWLGRCSFNHLKSFITKTEYKNGIKFRDIDEALCSDFKGYLDEKLNGETPYNYFKKFKKVIKKALKERLISEDFTANILNKKSKGLKKDILSYEELQTLFNTECANDDVKRFLFFPIILIKILWCS